MNFIDMGLGRFYIGDCLRVMREIPEGVIDLVLCDLPYGTTQNAWDSVIPFCELWEQYKRLSKVFVLTASQPFTSALVMSNVEDFKYSWVWQKTAPTGHLNARRMPLKSHEDILVFLSDGVRVYNPQGLMPFGKIARRGGNGGNFNKSGTSNFQEYTNYPRSVLNFAGDKGFHPTQKPVALFEYLIKTYTAENGLVLDNCAGSGTTAVACEQTRRRWVCIEKDPGYAKKAIDRIAAVL